MTILVTGGTGYIGSNTVVKLIENGYDVIIVDNFSNSKPIVLEKLKKITGKDIKFYEIDICNKRKFKTVFKENKIDAVIHFAGYKAVGESVAQPLKYYRNNIDSTLTLLELMKEYKVKKLVFSSSATVYGDPEELPIRENAKLSVTNPYGATKLYIEGILKDLYISDNEFRIAILRYFNPVGSDESGLLGEDPNGIPNNLMPYIVKVANKELPCLNIFGNDYETEDGTGKRDYLHVVDLAIGHVKALEKIEKEGKGLYTYNLGTGSAYSVLEIVNNFEKENNIKIPYKIAPRRDGDLAEICADASKAEKELGWKAKRGIAEMCRDSWNYQKKHININK